LRVVSFSWTPQRDAVALTQLGHSPGDLDMIVDLMQLPRT
jgi:hypothetical protein